MKADRRARVPVKREAAAIDSKSLRGGEAVQRRATNDYSVTLGSQVSWYPKAERWRIEVTDPQTMKAVWIAPRRASSHYRSGHARSGVGFRFGSNPPSRNRAAYPPGGNGELEGLAGRPAPRIGRLLSPLRLVNAGNLSPGLTQLDGGANGSPVSVRFHQRVIFRG